MKAETKDTNPKDAIGSSKVPMHLIPGSALGYLAIAFLEGGLKYGKYNWRVAGVRASIYLDAMDRHFEKWKNGEDCDEKTGVPHLASVMACASILLDADLIGKLVDDRPPRAPVSELLDELAEHVVYLQQLYEAEDPHQCTIEDSQWAPENDQMSTIRSTMQALRQRSNEPLATRPDERPRQLDLFERETEKKSTTKKPCPTVEVTIRPTEKS